MRETADALLICTRNRPAQIRARLEEYAQFETLPAMILIVDSSENNKTQEVVKNIGVQVVSRVAYLRCSPGLPHQRNQGVSWLRSHLPDLNYIYFLDDDVVVKANYFATVREIFSEYSEVVAIGGFDPELDPNQSTGLIRRILGIGSKKCGVIMSSGFAIPPYPKARAEQCEWLPGGMQSVRTWVFDHLEFDSQLRMYGEDVDFYLRLCVFGTIACSIDLPIQHLNDLTNKDSWREISLYHNGVRWLFAHRYPSRVLRTRVILTAMALAIGHLVIFVRTRDKIHRAASLGNLEFIFRLIKKMPVLQTVESVQT